MTLDVKEEKIKSIPAVVHIDNTARPQLVTKETNKSLYSILNEYEKFSKIPVLVNTSFNAHEEPIVCYAKDCIDSLKSGMIDILYIENQRIVLNKNS